MQYQTLRFEEDGGIAIVTIDRPQALNALNMVVFSELYQVFTRMDGDDTVRVAIVTGRGEKAFVAGTDITEMKSMSSLEVRKVVAAARQANDSIYNLGKPVIAAINGYALGGGLELALSCDLRICSEKARFGQPEINLGIIPGGGGTQRLMRLVGMARAKQLLFTGDLIDAQTALDMGLVSKVVPIGGLMNEARALAEKLCSKGAVALRLLKMAVNSGANMDLTSALDFEAQCFAMCFSTEDQKEGMNAFVEKRKPEFRGR